MINQHAVDYYSTLIDALIANNIIPVITLFHWDLPLYIENLGGATNPIFVDYFRDFAVVVFKSFGSRVSSRNFTLCLSLTIVLIAML